jgi:hypothetical protein
MIFRFPDWMMEGRSIIYDGEVWMIDRMWVTGDRCGDWGVLDISRNCGMFTENDTVKWDEVEPAKGKLVSKSIERLIKRDGTNRG